MGLLNWRSCTFCTFDSWGQIVLHKVSPRCWSICPPHPEHHHYICILYVYLSAFYSLTTPGDTVTSESLVFLSSTHDMKCSGLIPNIYLKRKMEKKKETGIQRCSRGKFWLDFLPALQCCTNDSSTLGLVLPSKNWDKSTTSNVLWKWKHMMHEKHLYFPDTTLGIP